MLSGMYAGGMTVRDIEAHLAELYGVHVGRDTISRVTDAVLEDVSAEATYSRSAAGDSRSAHVAIGPAHY